MRNFILSIVLLTFLLVKQSFANLECSRQNEIQRCVKECPPEKTCKNKDIKFNCINNKRCQIKCVCKEGFYRNYDGDCVSSEACERCPALNELFSCGSACDTTCATLGQQCPIVNIKCNEKCYCREAYARNDENICIPISDCISAANKLMDATCGSNEKYQACKKTCPPDTCLSLVAKFKCASDPPCVPGCICKSNFLRVKPNSSCIPIQQCPQLSNSPDFN